MLVENKINHVLRFIDDDGGDYPDWESNLLGMVASVTSGGTPSRSKLSYWSGKIPWITTSLINFNNIYKADEFITKEGLDNSSAKLLTPNTLLIAMYGQGKTRGKVAILKIKACTNQACASILPSDNISVIFLFQNLSGQYENLRNLSNDGGQKNLSGTLIKQLKISFPLKPEQQKIANFLSSVDTKIEQLSKKQNLLTQYKKGMMQKLFSQTIRFKADDGSDFPSIRKGRLKDFGFFYYGKSAPKTSVKPNAETPCVRYGELYSTYDENISEIKSYTDIPLSKLKLSKGGEVLVPRVGEDPLDFANCSYLPLANVAIGEMISVYNTKEDGLFITYYINSSLKKQLAKLVEGGSVSNLYFRYVENIEVQIPSKKEQMKVAKFLSSIDKKIEQINNQITQTKQFKKALLQQMFV
jgi:type I restriction enzyme S subunit